MSIWAGRLIILSWVVAVVAIIAFRFLAVRFEAPLLGVAGAVVLASVALLLLIGGQLMGAVRGQLAMSNGTALIYFVVGFILIAPAISSVLTGMKVPPIHDVTTDPDDPPVYIQTPLIRATTDNSLDLDAKTIALQREAYTDLQGLSVDMDVVNATAHAATIANSLGWEVTAQDNEQGHLEAVATTRIIGFKDDVVVRVKMTEAGTRLDVRSASRVGLSDLGANAARIREFIAAYQAKE